MGLYTFCHHILILLSLVLMVNSMTVYPGQNYTEGNCSGPVDYFLCNCLTSNTTIDIHLSPGRYQFRTQPFCLIPNKASVTITGNSPDVTIIECIEPFNIVFLRSRNIFISNIRMEKCGDVVNDFINQTVRLVVPAAYFGNGFRFAVKLYQVKNVTIANFTMTNTLGYGIGSFNALGGVMLSDVKIKDTNFNNDPKCKNYSYVSDTADFSCSGSGILLFYHDHVDIDGVDEADTNLTIDQSLFEGNLNILPVRQHHILDDVIKTGYYRVPIPIQGAGSIGIYYLQNFYDVNTEITNTIFHNNRGSLGASAAIISVSSTRGMTKFKDCLLSSEDTESVASNINGLHERGGISYFYLILRNAPGINYSTNATESGFTALDVVRCNFTRLGGSLGAALHIEKLSSDSLPLIIRIKECNFFENTANAGSAVYAVDGRFGASTSSGSLTVSLVNVNAEKNTISSGSTLEYETSDFITGVFYAKNSYFTLNCSQSCEFIGNQPSVFYGHFASITVSGQALFAHNSGYYGGAFDLINAIMYIDKGSTLLFTHNYATFHGGAIDVLFPATNVRSQDICPIQFIGPSSTDPIFSLDKLDLLDVNITFENNTVGTSRSLQSIYANVFYLCSWYPDTLTQYDFDLDVPPVNGTRDTVYPKVFNFVPNNAAHDHLFIYAGLPCPCDSDGIHDPVYCMSAGFNDTLVLNVSIIFGRSFRFSLIGLDTIGSVGVTKNLYSDIYISNKTDGTLSLAEGQNRRAFFTPNKTCTSVEFTVYGMRSQPPQAGILSLSFVTGVDYEFHVNFSSCPVGFSYQKDKDTGRYSCACGKFFKLGVNNDFHCDSATGVINHDNPRSWLSVSGDKVEYREVCLSTYCNRDVNSFTLLDPNIDTLLCDHNHAGRACGSCIEGYSRVFGSSSCKQCSDTWLATIVLYSLLGVILVFILFVLRLTVTVGAINGVIFFCNVMSINENLFFNENQFSFLRVFISLINLDLGFDMCFYNEMTQIAKTGLQFVFPVYLWLLILIIIFTGKFHFRRRRSSSYPAVPVLATLILLSYSKLLRTTISVSSYATIYYATNETDYNVVYHVVTWQPDSSIAYLQGWHCVLAVFSLGVVLIFVLPFAFASTFPKVILRSKRLSYFFPLLDCFYAPYKDKYRFWFGMRLIVLFYLSAMESVLFTYQESLLYSNVLAVLAFAIVQAYIRPFKSTLINILDLIFTGIFILLSVTSLYLYPSTSGYHEVNIAVNVLGFVAFFFFLIVILFHIHNAAKNTRWYDHVVSFLQVKFKVEKWDNFLLSSFHHKEDLVFKGKAEHPPDYIHLQESFLEQL
ncbi:uncharacterized protein [Dysidea avara]|uniref:uncharacterized protein n=1 Tax=Dysidea avara TaxID=196820 RepID=UPI0033319617